MSEFNLEIKWHIICIYYIQHHYLKPTVKGSVNLRGFVTDFGMGNVSVR